MVSAGGVLGEADIEEAIAGMVNLNKVASEVMREVGVSASTDVTGFGLVGHALELAGASGVPLQLFLNQLPAYPRALEMAAMGLVPEGAYRNREYYFPRVDGQAGCDPRYLDLLCDPQTSGGLLIAVPAERSALLQQKMAERGVAAPVIGAVGTGAPGRLQLVNR